jgi:hypothetical protein
MKAVSLEQLGFESFAGLVKTKFRVWTGLGVALELELAAVIPSPTAVPGGTDGLPYEQFTLYFLGPADRLLPQRIYWFEAAPLGRFEMFLVPVGHDPTGFRYEAVFNRSVKPR